MFGAQGIVSVGCEGEEVEVRTAKLGWGDIIQGLNCQSEDAVIKREGTREPWIVLSGGMIRVIWQYRLGLGAGQC